MQGAAHRPRRRQRCPPETGLGADSVVAGRVLYIGSTGNDSVVCYDLSNGAPLGTVAPTTFIDDEVKHVSGLAFDPDGSFYAAERHAKKIKQFTSTGKKVGNFITNLPDEPEFILYVPK